MLHCAVVLFWVQVPAASLIVELHRFSDHRASFSWCSQGLQKRLSHTACVRGPGPISVIETMQDSSAFVCWVRGVVFGPHFGLLPYYELFLSQEARCSPVLTDSRVCVNKAEMGTLKAGNEFIFLCVTICHSSGAPISISNSTLCLDTWIPQLFATVQEILSVLPSKVKNT